MAQCARKSLASGVTTLAIPLLVLGVSILLAASLYAHFLRVHRFLWDDPIHDRNSHYLYSLRLAREAHDGDLVAVLRDLNQAHIWPPLHGVLAAGVLLIGGADYRLAVLPSLAAWVATIVLAFLVGRRAAASNRTFTGLIAAVFVAASPAHRAFATDIMLESVGACLTLAALYFYLAAVQAPTHPSRAGRRLALTLTALFFEKYNYWALIVFALLLNEAAGRRGELLAYSRSRWSSVNWRPWLIGQLRRPSTWLIGGLLAAMVGVCLYGDQPLMLGSWSVSVYPPKNLLSVVSLVVLARLVWWWRQRGRDQIARLGPCLRAVVCWHAWPITVWTLLPGHLGGLLWYLGPANADPDQGFSVLGGLQDYSRWLIEDYHPAAALAVVAGALCLLGLFLRRGCARGGGAVLALTAVSAALTVLHPNHKARCLHSWIAALWITGGLGLAALLDRFPTVRGRSLRPLVAVALLAALVVGQSPALWVPGHAQEAGPCPQHTSLLDVTDSYLPDVMTSKHATVLAAVPVRVLTQWALLERNGKQHLEEHWYGFADDPEEQEKRFRRWLDSTDCETLIAIDPLPGKPLWQAGAECDRIGGLGEALAAQHVFRLVREQRFPDVRFRVRVFRNEERRLTRQ
jgi:hypothetical protein